MTADEKEEPKTAGEEPAEWGKAEFFDQLTASGQGSVYSYFNYEVSGFQKMRHTLVCRFIREHLKVPNDDAEAECRMLDAGCADGSLTHWLDGEYANSAVVGSDFSANVLAIARQKYPDLQFEEQGFPGATFDGGFDVIVCVEMIYYLPEDQRHEVIAEFAEMLKPGGTLILGSNLLGGKFCTEEQLKDYVAGHFEIESSQKLFLKNARRWLDGPFTIANHLSKPLPADRVPRGSRGKVARLLNFPIFRPFWKLFALVGECALRWRWPYALNQKLGARGWSRSPSHLLMCLRKK